MYILFNIHINMHINIASYIPININMRIPNLKRFW